MERFPLYISGISTSRLIVDGLKGNGTENEESRWLSSKRDLECSDEARWSAILYLSAEMCTDSSDSSVNHSGLTTTVNALC